MLLQKFLALLSINPLSNQISSFSILILGFGVKLNKRNYEFCSKTSFNLSTSFNLVKI